MATINNVFRKGKGEIMKKMKMTRVLFILTGVEKLVLEAINQINFKGICSFTDVSLKPETVFEVFNHNKSVVCRGVTEISEFKNSTVINVAVVESIYTLVPETNAINVKKAILLSNLVQLQIIIIVILEILSLILPLHQNHLNVLTVLIVDTWMMDLWTKTSISIEHYIRVKTSL